jgi:hypothetical protein
VPRRSRRLEEWPTAYRRHDKCTREITVRKDEITKRNHYIYENKRSCGEKSEKPAGAAVPALAGGAVPASRMIVRRALSIL